MPEPLILCLLTGAFVIAASTIGSAISGVCTVRAAQITAEATTSAATPKRKPRKRRRKK